MTLKYFSVTEEVLSATHWYVTTATDSNLQIKNKLGNNHSYSTFKSHPPALTEIVSEPNQDMMRGRIPSLCKSVYNYLIVIFTIGTYDAIKNSLSVPTATEQAVSIIKPNSVIEPPLYPPQYTHTHTHTHTH
jgi:hypothetical protein